MSEVPDSSSIPVSPAFAERQRRAAERREAEALAQEQIPDADPAAIDLGTIPGAAEHFAGALRAEDPAASSWVETRTAATWVSDCRAELAKWIQGYLESLVLGEPFNFDVAPQILQQPQGLVVGYTLVLSCRSPVLDPPCLAGGHFVSSGTPGPAELRAACDACLKSIAALRNKLLAVI